ncbi:MAG: hypothetical protein WKF94_15610 [Solirubrobacteraceae bacterium]
MRISWVHPSWRDLVIEELALDGDARRDFLSRCGLAGVLLALSSAGGRAGERVLPLLRVDADWDALCGRVHEQLPELADEELLALLEALQAAARHATDRAQLAEVEALAGLVLGWIARAWTHGRRLHGALVAAWLASDARLTAGFETPALAGLLIELAPGAGADLRRADDCEQLDEWLWLVEIARRHRLTDLTAIGFPGRYEDELKELLADADRGQPAYMSIVGRMDRLGLIAHELWHELLPPSPPPAGGRRARAAAARADPGLVDRVLRDLS